MLFSVIVPIYKAERYLQQCVDSILSQTYTDFELILVDDGSPDGCPALCDRYAATDARVRVIHKENNGALSARITGAQAAVGEYIVTVDSDDYIEPTLFEDLQKTIENDPCDIVLYNAVAFSEDTSFPMEHTVGEGIYRGDELKALFKKFMYDADLAAVNFGNIRFALWAKAVKRPLFLKYQQEAPTVIRKGDDLAAFAPMLYHCESLASLTKAYYHYRIIPTSMMRSYSDRDIVSLTELYAYLSRHCAEDYAVNLDMCILAMMLEHIVGIARTCDSYADFAKEHRKLLCPMLAELVNRVKTNRLRLIDRLKVSSLKHKAKFLYRLYKR